MIFLSMSVIPILGEAKADGLTTISDTASTVESSGFNKSITDTARVYLSRIYRKMFPNITQNAKNIKINIAPKILK